MSPGLTVEIIYSDEDLVELRVSADNGAFSGTADLYENHEAAGGLAEHFRAFPNSRSDARHHELGNFNPANGGGGVRLTLSQSDSLGHCVLSVRVRADSSDRVSPNAIATSPIRVEPAGIDAFVFELRSLGLRVGSKARLPGSAAA